MDKVSDFESGDYGFESRHGFLILNSFLNELICFLLKFCFSDFFIKEGPLNLYCFDPVFIIFHTFMI